MYTILLVDDHQIMRDGLRALLEASGEFRVVGEAETGGQAVALAARCHPHLVVMDLSLPGMNGIEATVELLRESPSSRVVILSMYDDESAVVQAMRSGARAASSSRRPARPTCSPPCARWRAAAPTSARRFPTSSSSVSAGAISAAITLPCWPR